MAKTVGQVGLLLCFVGILNYTLLAFKLIPVQLMGEHPFDRFTLVRFSSLLDHIGHFEVLHRHNLQWPPGRTQAQPTSTPPLISLMAASSAV